MVSRYLLPASVLLLAVGCSATVNGTLVDGLTNQPIPGKAADAGEDVESLRIIAKAVVEKDGKLETNVSAGMTCMSFSSDVGVDGSFSLAGLCTSSTAYQIELSDANYFLGETSMFPMGIDAKAPQTIKAWRAPNGAGINMLVGNDLSPIRTREKLATEIIKGTEDEKVMYPTGIPPQVPLIEAGSSIVLSGTANQALMLTPLVNTNRKIEFKVGEGMETGPSMQAWSYVGTKFTDDTTYERVAATIDESKVTTVEHGGHVVKFIPADAVSPPGRYALHAEGKDTAYIIDIGAAGEMPKAEEPAAE